MSRAGNDTLGFLGIAGLIAASFLLEAAPRTGPAAGGAKSGARGKDGAPIAADRPGTDARTPTEIPARGWWQAAKRAASGFSEDRLMTEAAGITFFTLLALFPALAAMVSIYGLFADPATVNDHLTALTGVLPEGGVTIITDQVKSLTANGRGTLGFGLVFGILTALWSANQGIKALFDALNVVYHEHEKRGYVARTALCLLFTLGAIVFVIVAMTAIVVVPVVLAYLGLEGSTPAMLSVLRWPALVVLLTLILAVVYRFGPSRTHAKWAWLSWGSGFASVLFVLASVGFSYYVSNFGTYNKTYGSLGAAVGFMTWIWISATIVLFGAELNAELEQQTDRDSTVGAEKPEGARGAFKADVKG